MKALWLVVFGLLASTAYAQTPPPMGQFMISPAPCDAGALLSNGWCVDVVTMPEPPPPNPTNPVPPVITGPFATITANKVQLTGTGIPGDIVSIAIDNVRDPGLVTVQPGGNWTFNANAVLANGNHVATAIQTNSVGSSAASAPLTFSVAAH